MRAWLLRWWRRLIEAGAQPIEVRLDTWAAARAERIEQMVMGLADLSANREAAITSVVRSLCDQQARTAAAHGELLARMVDRLGAVLDNQEATAARLAQLDARFTHLAILLTGKSATEVATTQGARSPRAFDFEHRQ